MLAVALRAWGVHRLELDARAPPPRVVEVVVVDLLVAEHRAPEGHHRGTDEGVDADVDQLHRSGIGHEVEPLGDGGDPPGQGDVTLRQGDGDTAGSERDSHRAGRQATLRDQDQLFVRSSPSITMMPLGPRT